MNDLRCFASVFLTCSLLVGAARAQGTDRAMAETMFADAKVLMEQGKFDQACPKFDDSFRAYPGTGALFNAAGCYEAAGKTATAWARYGEALAAARRDGSAERVTFAEERRAALAPKLARVTLQISDGVRATPGLEVKIEGRAVPPGAFGLALPVDPGRVIVEVHAPQRVPFRSETSIAEGGSAVVEIASLELAAAGEQPVPPPSAPVPVAPAAAPDAPPETGDDGRVQRTVGYALGGVGVVGLGLGIVFNVMGRSTAEEADENCLPDSAAGSCDVLSVDEFEDRQSKLDAAKANTIVSYVGLGVGAAALGAGILLIATAPNGKKPETRAHFVPVIGPDRIGLSFGGAL
ncbi:MAG TPA: tetratricopeptide repeat protein [Polyangiaceae bacterium]|nr:tetratricopeptide repeat protein [Polyangiaceae bacterium]